MAPDPYHCDAVFSVSLLLGFCTLLPAILSIGSADWVVLKNQSPCRDNSQLQNVAWERNYTHKNEEMLGSDFKRTLTVENSTIDINVNSAMERSRVVLILRSDREHERKIAARDNHNNTGNISTTNERTNGTVIYWANATESSHEPPKLCEEVKHNHRPARHKPQSRHEKIVLIANTKLLCVINDGDVNCQPLGGLYNQSNVPSYCFHGNWTRLNISSNGTLQCNTYHLARAMLTIHPVINILPLIAVPLTIISVVLIDAIAAFSTVNRKFKTLVGILLLTAGAMQLSHVVLLLCATKTEQLKLGLGTAGYFTAVSGVMCVVNAILLFFGPSCEQDSLQKDSPVSESQLEIPFENMNNREREINRYQSQGFVVGEGCEDDIEWGYSPLMLDTKEVEFELYAQSDGSEDEFYPEFLLYNKGVKITELPDENKPGTSKSLEKSPNIFTDKEEDTEEKRSLLRSLEEGNDSSHEGFQTNDLSLKSGATDTSQSINSSIEAIQESPPYNSDTSVNNLLQSKLYENHRHHEVRGTEQIMNMELTTVEETIRSVVQEQFLSGPAENEAKNYLYNETPGSEDGENMVATFDIEEAKPQEHEKIELFVRNDIEQTLRGILDDFAQDINLELPPSPVVSDNETETSSYVHLSDLDSSSEHSQGFSFREKLDGVELPQEETLSLTTQSYDDIKFKDTIAGESGCSSPNTKKAEQLSAPDIDDSEQPVECPPQKMISDDTREEFIQEAGASPSG